MNGEHNREIADIADKSGLRFEVCSDLLDLGWTFITAEGQPSLWIAPKSGNPDYIAHKEPNCDSSCGNLAPHRHGLPCHKNCKSCGAICHPECPAYLKE